MKTKEFKQLCAKYIKEPNLENENMLLRTIVYDTKFYVAIKIGNKGPRIRLIKNGQIGNVLWVYTNVNELDELTLKNYNLGEVTFEELVSNVNANMVDYIAINPNSENLILTAAQLSKLHREKNYSDTNYPLYLEKEQDFKVRAQRLSDVDSIVTSKNVFKIYNEAKEQKDESKIKELFNTFLNELTRHTKFYTPVYPTGEVDKFGNYVVGKNRVIYLVDEGEKEKNGSYYLFVDTKDIPKNIELDATKTFVSVFDFEDYVMMMDAAHGAIDNLKIVGESIIPIAKEEVYRYAAVMEAEKLKKDMTVLKGSYAPSEETDEIEQELVEYLNTEKNVLKAWLGREIELYKNGKNAYVYNLVLKLKNSNLDKISMKEQVRKILSNRLFSIYSVSKDVNEPQMKLIYEKQAKNTVNKKI